MKHLILPKTTMKRNNPIMLGLAVLTLTFTSCSKDDDSNDANETAITEEEAAEAIAMARTNAPDSATSQFFINVANNDFLNAGVRGPGYAVFGKVTEGMGVIDRIAGVQTGYQRGMADVPVSPVIIESAEEITKDN